MRTQTAGHIWCSIGEGTKIQKEKKLKSDLVAQL